MTNINGNRPTHFFSVNHITKPFSNKLIYGISLNNLSYFLSKSPGLNDCEQLDSNTFLGSLTLEEINLVLSEIENGHTQRPSLELINMEIFKIIARIRNPLKVILPNKV